MFSRVWPWDSIWTVAYQAPCPWDSPGNSPGVDCHFFLQGIFPTQGSNPGLPHCTQTLYRLSHQGSQKVKSLSRVWLFSTPWNVDRQAPLSMGFSRQQYWSGWPFPSPGDFPNPGIEPESPTLQVDTLSSEPPGKLLVDWLIYLLQIILHSVNSFFFLIFLIFIVN